MSNKLQDNTKSKWEIINSDLGPNKIPKMSAIPLKCVSPFIFLPIQKKTKPKTLPKIHTPHTKSQETQDQFSWHP